MAIQLSGVQWAGKEEVLGLSELAFKSLHSGARTSVVGVLGCARASGNAPLPWITVDHKAPFLSTGAMWSLGY